MTLSLTFDSFKMRSLEVSDQRDRGVTVAHLSADCNSLIALDNVEHPFRIIKRQFGPGEVRLRGLAKNTARVATLFALANLWIARKQLMAMAEVVRPRKAGGVLALFRDLP